MALLKRTLVGLSWSPVSQDFEWRFKELHEDIIDGVHHIGERESSQWFKPSVDDGVTYESIQENWVIIAARETIIQQMSLVMNFVKNIPKRVTITEEGVKRGVIEEEDKYWRIG